MLAYAAGRPRIGARQSSPNAMLFVICGHIVLIAVVMSAKLRFRREFSIHRRRSSRSRCRMSHPRFQCRLLASRRR